MTQPEAKPSPPFGMEVCPACGAYILQGWPIRRVPALSPEDLEALREVRDAMHSDIIDWSREESIISALIEKLEAK